MSINKYSYVVSYEFLNETSKLHKTPIEFLYEDYLEARGKFSELVFSASDMAVHVIGYTARITLADIDNKTFRKVTIS